MLAHRPFVTKIMMLFEQAVEQRFFRRAPHLRELQRRQLPKCPCERTFFDRYARGPGAFGDPIPHRAFDRRQLDLACAVKCQQQSAAQHVAQRAVGLLPLCQASHNSHDSFQRLSCGRS